MQAVCKPFLLSHIMHGLERKEDYEVGMVCRSKIHVHHGDLVSQAEKKKLCLPLLMPELFGLDSVLLCGFCDVVRLEVLLNLVNSGQWLWENTFMHLQQMPLSEGTSKTTLNQPPDKLSAGSQSVTDFQLREAGLL